MHFHREGSGSPIVLLHGLGSRWQVWRPVLDALAERHDVIALDLPGFGGTPSDGGPGSVPHLADRVAAFLDELGVHRPAVGGSSLGGGIALELGRRGIARSVTAFSPVGFFGTLGALWCRTTLSAARAAGTLLAPAVPTLMSHPAGRAALCGLFFGRPAALAPADCIDDCRALVGAPGFTAAHRSLGGWRVAAPPAHRTATQHRDTMAVPLAGIPVTVAWGTRDVVLPHWQARRARRLLPHARHIRLPGCGHLPFADDPRACARLLLANA